MKGKSRNNRFLKGQTLIIALIILFVLLIIGFVFLGILNRNIIQASNAQQRSLAADLADAGVRYAQEQLLNSPLGADWRPAPTLPLVIEDGATPPNIYSYPAKPPPNNVPLYADDPDYYWLRPASLQQSTSTPTSSGFFLSGLQPLNQVDMGGPDGLGPFSRVQFKNGRALIRVRYAPSDIDVNAGSTDPASYYGPLRQPGLAHMYTIIESVGRPGLLNPNDPTTVPQLTNLPAVSPYVNANNAVMYQYFPTEAALQGAESVWAQADNQFVQSRKLMAFASIGIIDHLLFITNKEGSQNTIGVGIPTDLGVSDPGNPTASPMPALVMGNGLPYTNSGLPALNGSNLPGGASIYVNGNVTFYGNIIANVNQTLGDAICVAGTITQGTDSVGANPASIQMNVYQGLNEIWGPSPTAQHPATPLVISSDSSNGGPMSSADPAFNTNNGVYRDDATTPDASLQPRDVPTKQPPSILHIDPDTNNNRYLTITRDSGPIGSAGYAGQYGHGAGVYVNNSADLQVQNDPNGHIIANSTESLFYDFLNPDNGQPGNAWQGPYYVPPGAYLQLEPDGFFITLDNQQTFKDMNGNDSGLSQIRYRIGAVTVNNQQQNYIVDTLTPNVDVNAAFGSINFSLGQPFNGVLYFEGNLRVRGSIPTSCPLTVVSMGNIYIEGSITKGIYNANSANPGIIAQLPTTGLALLARDYVVVNTTQFFGPGPNPVTPGPANPPSIDPIDMPPALGSQIGLLSELLLDPDHSQSGQPNNLNPSFWTWYSGEYATGPSGTSPETTNMLFTWTKDNSSAAETYVSLDVDEGVGSWNYLFPQADGQPNDPVYTLGLESYQVYNKYESANFPFLVPNNVSTLGVANYSPNTNTSAGAFGGMPEVSTPFTLHPPANTPNAPAGDLYVGRTAIVPDDIRIEAVMYAEEGSFFIIPGDWYNTNYNDTRANYLSGGSNDLQRLTDYGNSPYIPFYQEPLDVKITIVGAINENLPAPVSQQVQMYQKWGWIPAYHGASGEQIPTVHNDKADGFDVYATSGTPATYVPNLYLKYDPNLGTGRMGGFEPSTTNGPLRKNPQDPTGLSMLPPLPCLPVSPTLFYFGEVNP